MQLRKPAKGEEQPCTSSMYQGLLFGWHVTGNANLPPPLCPQQLVMDSPEVLNGLLACVVPQAHWAF